MNTVMNFGSIKCGEFLDWLQNHYTLCTHFKILLAYFTGFLSIHDASLACLITQQCSLCYETLAPQSAPPYAITHYNTSQYVTYLAINTCIVSFCRPVAGSKTDIRGKRAHTHISREVLQLCQIIYEHGEPIEDMTEDGRNQIVISFGELFQVHYDTSSIGPTIFHLSLRPRKYLPDMKTSKLFNYDYFLRSEVLKATPNTYAVFRTHLLHVLGGKKGDK